MQPTMSASTMNLEREEVSGQRPARGAGAGGGEGGGVGVYRISKSTLAS